MPKLFLKALRPLQYRWLKWRMPYIAKIMAFDKRGLHFIVSSPVEHFRVSQHGGETQYLGAMLNALRQEDVLWDIGANIGLVCIHAGRICRSIAFEPDPHIYTRLQSNVSINPPTTLELCNVAISDQDSRVVLYRDHHFINSSSLVNQRGEQSQSLVIARSIDSLLEEQTLPTPTVIKLDIEGAEILALKGAVQLLTSEARPRAFFIEIHSSLLPAFSSSEEEVFEILCQYGYTQIDYQHRRAGELHLILSQPLPGPVSNL